MKGAKSSVLKQETKIKRFENEQNNLSTHTFTWIEIFVFLAVLGKSKAAQLIDDLHPGDVSGEIMRGSTKQPTFGV